LEGFAGVSQTINSFYMGKCHTVLDFQPMAKTKANYISLVNNNGLESLAGLPVSKQMLGLLLVRNENLSDISRLQEVETFVDDFIETNDRVWIKDNPKISFCSYPAICDLVVNLGPPYVNISGNVMDCLDNESVKAACITSTSDHGYETEQWVVVMNQTILFLKDNLKDAKMYDSCGKLIWCQNTPAKGYELDLTSFSSGLYLLQLQDAENTLKTIKWIAD
jgi:hypothetical protein